MSTTRTDHMKYLPHMDILSSDMLDDVLLYRNAFHNEDYTDRDVRSALQKDDLSPHDFMALLSTAALPFLEKWHKKPKPLQGSTSAIPSPCSRPFILPITVKITASTAVLTRTIILNGPA